MQLSADHCPADPAAIAKAYALDQLSDADAQAFENHCITCTLCTELVQLTEDMVHGICIAAHLPNQPLRFTHATEVGLVVSEVVGTDDGKWLAKHYGPRLEGGKITDELAEANRYLVASFYLMFPGHICGDGCMPASWAQ